MESFTGEAFAPFLTSGYSGEAGITAEGGSVVQFNSNQMRTKELSPPSKWEQLLTSTEVESIELLVHHEPSFAVRESVKKRALALILHQRGLEDGATSVERSNNAAKRDTRGFVEASRILGHDLSLNDNLIMAGWLHLIHCQRMVPDNIASYLTILERRLNPQVKAFIQLHAYRLEQLLQHYRWVNYRYTYTAARSLTELYLLKPQLKGELAENASLMFLRVAVQMHHREGVEAVVQCYHQLALSRFMPATPTLLNAGGKKPQMSSCFLMSVDDNLPSMYSQLFDGAMLSASKGGLGVDFSTVRHSEIDEVSLSSGVIPLLKVFNEMLAHVDQGGKRKGAASTFLRPHHLDTLEFINLTDPVGDHNARAHNLNTVLWMPWIFWQRVRENGMWTLFCPNKVKQLNNTFGKDFERLYVEAEADPSISAGYRKVVRARELLSQIHRVERSSGKPFIMNGDSCNFKSPHRHLGYIRSSNLCVAGDTPLLTRSGYYNIGELEGMEVEVWNGVEWSRTTIQCTGGGRARPLVTVYFSDGSDLRCTFNHTFLLENENERSPTDEEGIRATIRGAKRVMACELKKGMKLFTHHRMPMVGRENRTMKPSIGNVAHRLNTIEEPEVSFSHPYTHAVFCMLGSETIDITGNEPKVLRVRTLELCGKYCELRPWLELNDEGELPSNLPSHLQVPLNESFEVRISWMAGLLDSGGIYCGEEGVVTVSHGRSSFMDEVRLLSHTLGMRGTLKCEGQLWSFSIPVLQLLPLIIEGMPIKTLELAHNEFRTSLEVESVVNHGDCERTYCFSEKELQTGIFNGVLTGQCLEIVEYTDHQHTNVCNLCSINLPHFTATYHHPAPNFKQLVSRINFSEYCRQVRDCVVNLNRVIDNNFYPSLHGDNEEHNKLRETNRKHRAIGLGIQGMAELFYRLDLGYCSEWARTLDEMIYAALYYNALLSSCQLAIREGKCEIFEGSTYSEGKLQFHLWSEEHLLRWGAGPSRSGARKYHDTLPISPISWGQEPYELHSKEGVLLETIPPSWESLAAAVKKYGLRNSLLTCQMPTASTSRILGNCESNEVHLRNIYAAKVINGDFPYLNGWMVRDLERIGLWSHELKELIVSRDAVLTGLSTLLQEDSSLLPQFKRTPEAMARLRHLEAKYVTMWEVPQKEVLIRAANRGKYLDQSQSMSLFMVDTAEEKLTAAHLLADELGLKTIMYYLRTQSSRGSGNITNNITNNAQNNSNGEEKNEHRNVELQSSGSENTSCGEDVCHSCSG